MKNTVWAAPGLYPFINEGSTRGVCDPKGAESPGNGPGKGPGSKSVISIAFRFQFGTLPQAPHSLTRGVRGSVD